MVDDILLSPEEQDERAKQWLKDNGMALVMGVVLGLGAVYAFNAYKDQQIINAEEASALYSQIISSVKDSDNADIENRFAALKDEHAGSSYAAKAVLLRARQLSVSNLDDALNELEWVSNNTDELGIVHAARVRQAKVLIALERLDEAKILVETQPYDGFDSYYQEILGDIASMQDRFEEARSHYQNAIDQVGAVGTSYISILNLKMNRLPQSANNIDSDDEKGMTEEDAEDKSEEAS